MFERLFGKVSDVVYHRIGPYVVERQRFVEDCAELRFGKRGLEPIAGILLTAATDLQAHGGLDVDWQTFSFCCRGSRPIWATSAWPRRSAI